MHRLGLAATLALVLATGAAASADDLKADCTTQTLAGGKRAGSCAIETVGSANRDVLFYFHGRGETHLMNERTWLEDDYYPAAIRARWRERGFAAPLVIAVSFGGTWFLTERDASPLNVPLALFEEAFVAPHAERRILAMGESMGGLNSLSLAFKSRFPFAKVASLCPIVADISPFASRDEIDAFLRAHPETNRPLFEDSLRLGRVLFPQPGEWTAASLLEIARARQAPWGFAAHVSAGRMDPYGLFTGVSMLIDELRRTGTRADWLPMDRGHCAIDPVAIADFLAEER